MIPINYPLWFPFRESPGHSLSAFARRAVREGGLKYQPMVAFSRRFVGFPWLVFVGIYSWGLKSHLTGKMFDLRKDESPVSSFGFLLGRRWKRCTLSPLLAQ